MNVVSLMATALIGMLGWFFAWRARGEAGDERRRAESALAGEIAAKAMALEATQAKLTAEGMGAAQRSRADGLALQLDTERASKQALIDALAKAGAPVGPVVVDSALDGLYKNGRSQGADSNTGGNPTGVSGQPASAPSSPSKR
jgi:hypothetical protein